MNRVMTLRNCGWLPRLAACALTAAFSLPLLTLVATAGQEVTVDGVVHVKNPAKPPQGVETMQLEEVWRAGGAGEDQTVFGVILQAFPDEQGNLYVLDTQLSQVFVFSSEGKLLRTLSREGEGPGETRNPTDMFFMSDGSLGLVQAFPGKIVKLKLDNTPTGSLEMKRGEGGPQGLAVILDGDWRGGNLVFAGLDVIVGNSQTQQTRKNFLAAYGEDGVEKVRYWEQTQTMDFTNLQINEGEQYNIFPRRWDITASGDVYVAPDRNQYCVNVYAADGKLKRVIEREFVNRKRTEDELSFLRKAADAQLAAFPGESHITIGEHPEAIQALDVAPDGTLWVVSAHGNHEPPAGIMNTYDVFDPQGNYLKQVAVACNGDSKNDVLIRIGADRMLLVTDLVPAAMSLQGGGGWAIGDQEPEPMELVCFRIKG